MKNEKMNLEAAVLEVFSIPQCLTEGLTPEFVMDIVDFYSSDQDWFELNPNDKLNLVVDTLSSLEKQNRLSSKSVRRKFMKVLDDENEPASFKKATVYQLSRAKVRML